MPKHILFFIAISAVFWLSVPAVAIEEARDLHQKGVELFKSEKYEEAAKAFREAHRLRPTWKLFYNIGQCEAASKRYGLALEAFEAYLVRGGDNVPEDRREYVSAEIRRIQPLVGILDIESDAGIEVLIDHLTEKEIKKAIQHFEFDFLTKLDIEEKLPLQEALGFTRGIGLAIKTPQDLSLFIAEMLTTQAPGLTLFTKKLNDKGNYECRLRYSYNGQYLKLLLVIKNDGSIVTLYKDPY